MKVGDRVRVARIEGNPEDTPWYKVGNVGMITALSEFEATVMFDEDAFGNEDFWYVSPNELEVISNDEAAD